MSENEAKCYRDRDKILEHALFYFVHKTIKTR